MSGHILRTILNAQLKLRKPHDVDGLLEKGIGDTIHKCTVYQIVFSMWACTSTAEQSYK